MICFCLHISQVPVSDLRSIVPEADMPMNFRHRGHLPTFRSPCAQIILMQATQNWVVEEVCEPQQGRSAREKPGCDESSKQIAQDGSSGADGAAMVEGAGGGGGGRGGAALGGEGVFGRGGANKIQGGSEAFSSRPPSMVLLFAHLDYSFARRCRSAEADDTTDDNTTEHVDAEVFILYTVEWLVEKL